MTLQRMTAHARQWTITANAGLILRLTQFNKTKTPRSGNVSL